jgi:glycosyltransferase involved in cell wall biosynthesis
MHGIAAHKSVSVVVASRDRPVQLRACLQSIRRGTLQPAEVIVVDGASRDPASVAQVAREAGTALLRTERPGAARARNIGLQATDAQLIALTDDDAIVDRDWLVGIVDGFSDASVQAVVGPVFELGTTPPALLYNRAGFNPSVDRAYFSRAQPDWFERAALGALGFGANLALRRGALELNGLFRESLGAGAPIGGDENYYLLTLIERGGAVVNQPRARVFHPRTTNGHARSAAVSAVPYVLFVLATRPALRALVTKRLLRQLRQGEIGRLGAAASPPQLVRGLVVSPAQLLAAWVIERRAEKAAIRPAPDLRCPVS